MYGEKTAVLGDVKSREECLFSLEQRESCSGVKGLVSTEEKVNRSARRAQDLQTIRCVC